MFKINGLVPAVPLDPQAPATLGAALAHAAARALESVMEWHDRSMQRHSLASLDDYALKDLGLSRADVDGEARKPFWRR